MARCGCRAVLYLIEGEPDRARCLLNALFSRADTFMATSPFRMDKPCPFHEPERKRGHVYLVKIILWCARSAAVAIGATGGADGRHHDGRLRRLRGVVHPQHSRHHAPVRAADGGHTGLRVGGR